MKIFITFLLFATAMFGGTASLSVATSNGVQWKLTSESIWRNSGASVNYNPGNYYIQVKAKTGYAVKSNTPISLASGEVKSVVIPIQFLSIVTWKPANLTYGSSVSAAQLNATVNSNGVGGTTTYNVSAGDAFEAGTVVLTMQFVPNNSTLASPLTVTRNVTVAKRALSVAINNLTVQDVCTIPGSSLMPGASAAVKVSRPVWSFTPTGYVSYSGCAVVHARTFNQLNYMGFDVDRTIIEVDGDETVILNVAPDFYKNWYGTYVVSFNDFGVPTAAQLFHVTDTVSATALSQYIQTLQTKYIIVTNYPQYTAPVVNGINKWTGTINSTTDSKTAASIRLVDPTTQTSVQFSSNNPTNYSELWWFGGPVTNSVVGSMGVVTPVAANAPGVYPVTSFTSQLSSPDYTFTYQNSAKLTVMGSSQNPPTAITTYAGVVFRPADTYVGVSYCVVQGGSGAGNPNLQYSVNDSEWADVPRNGSYLFDVGSILLPGTHTYFFRARWQGFAPNLASNYSPVILRIKFKK